MIPFNDQRSSALIGITDAKRIERALRQPNANTFRLVPPSRFMSDDDRVPPSERRTRLILRPNRLPVPSRLRYTHERLGGASTSDWRRSDPDSRGEPCGAPERAAWRFQMSHLLLPAR
jgi:hypothetical protein